MISELRRQTEVDRKSLAVCHYGRKILCNLVAYGTKYSFCRFFRLKSHDKTAWMMLQNSTLLISTQADFSKDAEAHAELSLFVEMHQPFRIEGAQSLLSGLQLKGYQTLHRSVFRLEPGGISPVFDPEQVNRAPKLDDVYEILTEGFPNLIAHDIWLTDTSHMVRRGLRQCFTYYNVTAATAIYDYGDQVLIGGNDRYEGMCYKCYRDLIRRRDNGN